LDQVKNPFSPGAGHQPPELVGRSEFLSGAEVLVERVRHGRPARSILLTGLRGVGKTVLLNQVKERAAAAGYVTVTVETPEDATLAEVLSPQLRTVLFELARSGGSSSVSRRALGVLKSFVSAFRVRYAGVELALEFEPVPGVADSGDLQTDLPQLFLEVAEASAEQGKGVALLVDEMQYLPEVDLRALIMAMHRLAQENKPLILVGAGLPSLLGLTGRARSYAERLFSFPKIGALPAHEARRAIKDPVVAAGVGIEDDALNKIFEVTQGYPYFLQEWGFHAWNIATSSPITLTDVERATTRAISQLDQGFFRVRFDRLTPAEKRYLRAMAELGPGPQRTGDIATTLQIRATSVGPTRGILINKGMIYSPEHGRLAFTVPLFDEFMKRVMPELPERR
jgi:hypothetical protein